MPGTPRDLRLPRRLHDVLIAYGQTSPSSEVCGLLGGSDARLTSFYPVRNIADDPENSFLLDAEGQIETMRRMRDSGESLRAIFHSHPDAPAEPSATDLAMAAYPDVYYLILSLQGETPVLAAFYYDGRTFRPAGLRLE